MGRPLNKKYFGNRNIGTTGTGDNGIGGEGIASINWSDAGSWLATTSGSAPLAGLALPAPTLPGGVQATWTNYFGAYEVTTGAGKTGLVLNETYEYAAIPGLLVTVSNLGGANAVFTVTTAGSTTTLLQDLQGVNLTKTAGMTGVATFLVDIKMKLVNTVINEKGSGYTGAETFTVTTVNGATGGAPAGTIVLTTDSNSAGTSTNQENAIIGYAYVPAANGGTQRLVCDIKKQTNDRRYKVTTSEGTGICQLRTDGSNGAGTMDITAYDSAGGEYWVAKLTSRKAVLVQKGVGGGTQFATGASVPWTLGNAVASYSVKLQNA